MPDFLVNGSDNWERQQFLKMLDEYFKKYGLTAVQISKCPVKNSRQIIKYLHGVVLKYILEYVSTPDDHETRQQLYDYYKLRFLPEILDIYHYQTLEDDDEMSLSTKSYEIQWAFVQKVRQHALEDLNIVTPDPEKVIRRDFSPKDWM